METKEKSPAPSQKSKARGYCTECQLEINDTRPAEPCIDCDLPSCYDCLETCEDCCHLVCETCYQNHECRYWESDSDAEVFSDTDSASTDVDREE